MPVSSNHTRVLSLAYTALLVALMAICAWITLPLGPVPFTMQTFGVFAALGLLGGRRGTLAIGAYLLVGLVGLPVFSGFSGGAASLLGPTGGYLLGFLAAGLVYWAVTAGGRTSLGWMILAMALGMVVCYAFGTAWFLVVYTGGGSAATLTGALGLCVVPYLLPDAGKIALAVVVARRVGRHLKR